MTPPAAPPRQKLIGLQVLRAIAANLVVVDHAILWLVAKGLIGPQYKSTAIIFGDMGVYTFFVISGYIMMHAHSRDFARTSLSRYALKRLIRIVPMYWAATAITIIHDIAKGVPLGGAYRVIGSFLFVTLTSSAGGPMRPVLGQGWTLTYEMIFYAIFGASLLFHRKAGVSITVLSLVIIVVTGTIIKPISDLSGPRTMATFYTNPILLLFVGGLAVHVIKEKKMGTFNVSEIVAPATLIIFCITIQKVRSEIDDDLTYRILQYVIATIAVLLAVFNTTARKNKFTSSVLERVGDSSYSVYLFHPLFCMALGQAMLHLGLSPTPILFVLLCLVGSNCVGLLINHFAERPLTVWLSKRSVRAVR